MNVVSPNRTSLVELRCVSNYSPGSALYFDRIELLGLSNYSACQTTVRVVLQCVYQDGFSLFQVRRDYGVEFLLLLFSTARSAVLARP